MEKQYVLQIINICLQPLWLYHIFPHSIFEQHDFLEKNLFNIKCVFWFSLQFCLKCSSFQEELSGIL